MLHAYDQKFDVTKNLENFCELNKALPKIGLFFRSSVGPHFLPIK